MRTLRHHIMLAVGLCGMLFALSASSQKTTNSAPKRFLLKVIETEIEQTRTGVTSTDCLVVQPNGTFQMQRRLQQLPAPYANLAVYEGVFNEAELSDLKKILDAHEVAALPHFHYLSPGNFYEIHSLEAVISRSTGTQYVGYYTWKTNPQRDSFDYAADLLKPTQDVAAEALEPLKEWFHHVEATQVGSSKAKSIPCDLEESDK